MTPLEMLDLCERQHATSLSFVTLTIPYRRHKSERVRILPGVLGRVVGSQDGKLICSVAAADLRKYVVRYLTNIEGYALELAEAGKHEEADHWMAQYVAVRDRLNAGMGTPRGGV